MWMRTHKKVLFTLCIMLALTVASLSSSGAASAATTSQNAQQQGVASARAIKLWGYRSGLPWLSGVYANPTMLGSTTEQFCAWRGRPCDTANVYTTRDSWQDITDPQNLYQSFAGWPGIFVLSEPMWPEGSGGSFSACAAGNYDSNWRNLGTSLVKAGHAYTIVRLGWEMNGNWFEWSGSDPAGFISCYQHIATDIRATDRWVVMDWTQNAHGSQTCNGQAINCYPGDAYVDVIGIDNYDMWPGSPDQAIWDSQCNGPDGMCTLAAFARKHHKMFGVGEWSVAPGEGVNGGGDNPFYIQTMFKFFVKNADILLYENYFNFSQGPDGAIWNPNDNPLSAAEYQKLYSIKHFRTTKAE